MENTKKSTGLYWALFFCIFSCIRFSL